MIQRIQTLYLILGAVAIGALGFVDLPWSSQAASVHTWFVPAVIGLMIVSIALAGWAIFLYTNRSKQRTVVVGVQVVTLCLAATLYGGLYLTSELTFVGREGVQWGRMIVLFLPIVAYLFFFLARRGIDHDIELVKSMDRIR